MTYRQKGLSTFGRARRAISLFGTGAGGVCMLVVATALNAGPADAGPKSLQGFFPKGPPAGELTDEQKALKEKFETIDFGFRVFTEETFEGNGRTCATCHLPEENYTMNADDVRKLKGADLELVTLENTVPGLENPTLVKKLALFNTEGGDSLNPEEHPAPPEVGPFFRGSMTVGPLALTQVFQLGPNNFTPMLGWTGRGSPGGGFHHNNDDPDANGSVRAFANGAIAQHFTTSLDRVAKGNACAGAGKDDICNAPYTFRFGDADELDALRDFQNWLGRRAVSETDNEFPLDRLTFANARAESGKALYMSNQASCNVCHTDGGGNFLGFANIPQHSNVNALHERITELTGVFIPEDEGFVPLIPNTPLANPEAFNIQPVIEAARKKAFFHNHGFIPEREGTHGGSTKFARARFLGKLVKKAKHGHDKSLTTTIEDATRFYFSEAFEVSEIRAALRGLLTGGGGPDHIDDLDEFLAFGGPNAIEEMGAFMRALSAYYLLRDCERLIQESIDRIDVHVSPRVSSKHCGFNLKQTRNVLSGAQVYPKPYWRIALRAQSLRPALAFATKLRHKQGLQRIMGEIAKLKDQIATVEPEVEAP